MAIAAGLGTNVKPSITVMHMPLNPMASDFLLRTVVDTSLHRPDMFELTFLDRDGAILDLTHLSIGAEVSISVGDGPASSRQQTGLAATHRVNNFADRADDHHRRQSTSQRMWAGLRRRNGGEDYVFGRLSVRTRQRYR